MFKKTALLSVYHKEGIVAFAQALVALGWTILASGGTAKTLIDAGVPVKDVASLVGGGPILGHKVVTLSREVHAGLLAYDTQEDQQELERLGIPWIDLVCVDLYPLEDAIKTQGDNREAVRDKTDIGGPAMLRSASKGRRIVICDPKDRQFVIDRLQADGDINLFDREALASKAEYVVANYCLASARYLSNGDIDGIMGVRALICKYGENAHQPGAALFESDPDDQFSLARFKLVQGTAPSYNNLCDVDREVLTLTHIATAFQRNFGEVPRIAIAVKHGNPCGASFGDKALEQMIDGDRRAIFGGVSMVNFQIGEPEAETLIHYGVDGKRLLDGIAAMSFTPEARDILARKGGKCRLLENGALVSTIFGFNCLDDTPRIRKVSGGFLMQPNYSYVFNVNHPELQKDGPELSNSDIQTLLLGWAVNATSNSNTITLVKNGMLIGNGTGQQDRIGAAELAIKKARDAGHDVRGSIAISDSFFPFPDGPKVLIDAGVKAIIGTRGSVKDEDVRRVILEAGLTFWTMPDALGRGFFGH